MKKYIIDTNALISFVTDRNRAQQEVVAPLFNAAARMKCSLLCHQFVLSEFVFVMEKVYNTPKETINAMLRDFIAMPGVKIIQETDFAILLNLWPTAIADFGDGLIAATGKMSKGAEIVTFDEKFRAALARHQLNAVYP
ncbi:MAG: PIN domain-containing protein [Desulfuromonadales bacterium]|nr:PIN domain-containing protein [Desulfuromonadales bacterium]